MKKNKAIGVVVAIALFLGLLTYTTAVGFGPTGTGAAKNITLGLDLSGGVSITYEVVGDENPSAEDMKDTIYKLQQRVDGYSTEAQVYQEGTNRINIEIPGVSDANTILEELGKPGSLQFQLEDGTVVVDGSQVASAEAGVQQDNLKNNENVVKLEFDSAGAAAFATATSENIGKSIYIVYDGDVISAPTVKSAITDGSAVITGMADAQEAENLASSIRIGSLSLELQELRSNVVGAQLGEAAISTSLKAGAIGLALVCIFMMVVYLLPGVVAAISLLLYTVLTLVTLNAFDITLTLPGIAGIILGIGMAVDANVIIYARIREEIAAGKSVKSAIDIGFKKALSAILDGNITTLIAAIVLGIMGTGSVKGFAYTLAMSIILSMFSALVISRYLAKAFYALGFQDVKYYGCPKKHNTIDFLKHKKVFFAIAIVCMISGPVAMLIHSQGSGKALNYSLEFMGGTSTNVTFNEDYSIEEIDEKVKPVVQEVTGDANIQATKVSGSNQVIIKTRELSLDHGWIYAGEEQVLSLEALAQEAYYSLSNSSVLTAEVSTQVKKNTLATGCCFAEVEVDMKLGTIQILNIINVHDSGKLLNPQLAQMQVHGGMSMGMGYGLSEQLVLDEKTGRPLNGNLLDYKLMTALDTPDIKADFVELDDPMGPYGNKALGEPPAIPGAPAIRNAVLHATGVAFNEIPLTPQRLIEGFKKAGLI